MKVLLVDDDVDLLDVTSYALRREGFAVVVATDGRQALSRWEADKPDLVILDVGLPQIDGFEVCRHIRQNGSTPIIFLTGLTSDDQVVQGFRLGADDYVTKPFSPRQLAMRIRAVRRRVTGSEPEPSRELRVGELVIDVEAHQARRGEQTVHLTPIEFRLLYILAMNAGHVVGGARLVEYAWEYETGDIYLLKTHICHIRKKFRGQLNSPVAIQGISGVGYRLVAAARDLGTP